MIDSTRPMMRGYEWLQKGVFSGHMSPGDVLYHGMPYQLIMFAGSQRKQRSLPSLLFLFLLYKKSLSLWENRTLSEMSVDQNPRLVSPRFLQQTVEVAFLDTKDCWVQDRARVVGLDWKLKSSDLDTNQERPSPIQGSHQVCVSCRSLSIFSKGQDAPSAWLMWVLSTFWINNIKRLVS